MARKTQAEKAINRTKILEAAALLIRKQGIENTSVAEIMNHIGMTHGGFYRHFESKDHLITEAIGEAFKAGLDVFDDDHKGTPDEATEYIKQYLSDLHIATPGIGCPIPILSSEIARGSDPWREALITGVSHATSKLSEGIEGISKSDALVLLSTLVGTLVLARGINEDPLRELLLNASREHVSSLLS